MTSCRHALITPPARHGRATGVRGVAPWPGAALPDGAGRCGGTGWCPVGYSGGVRAGVRSLALALALLLALLGAACGDAGGAGSATRVPNQPTSVPFSPTRVP